MDDLNALVDIAKQYCVKSRAHYMEIGTHKVTPNIQATDKAAKILQGGAFGSILNSAWFTGTYIVQEVALAKHV